MRCASLLVALVTVCFIVVACGGSQVKPVFEEPTISLPGDMLFDINSAQLKPEARAELQRWARDMLMRETAQSHSFFVEGHACDIGTRAYNVELSQKRADVIARVLIDEFGVDRSRVVARGYGSDRPVAHNISEENRMKNRRVVILLEAEATAP